MPSLPRPIRRRRGAALSNYALLAGLVAVVSVGAVAVSGTRTGCLLQQAAFGLVGQEAPCATSGGPTDPTDPTPPGENRAPVLSQAPLSRGSVGAAYLGQFSAADPDGDPLTWTLAGGALPAGLTLGADGRISGIPTEGGLFSFDVLVSDGRDGTDAGSFVLSINRPPVLSTSGLVGTPLVAGQPFSTALVATDPDGDPLTWAVVGALPDGLSLSAAGVISGVPTGAGATFQVRVTDQGGLTSTQTLRLNAAPVLSVASTASLEAGVPADLPLGASDPDGQAVSLSVTPALPAGLALEGGRITGTPEAVGTTVLTVVATDPDGAQSSAPLTLSVLDAVVFQTPEGLLTSFGQVGLFSTSVLALDPAGRPLTYTLAGGSLPTGLTLGTDGGISGSPTGPGATFTVRATADDGRFAARTFRLNAGPIIAATDPLPQGAAGTGYSLDLGLSDPDGPAPTAVVAGGDLPPGMSLSSAGVLSGVPAEGGVFSFDVRATDAEGATTTRSYSLAVSGGPVFQAAAGFFASYTIDGPPLDVSIVAIDAGGGPVSYALAAGSTLPPGVVLGADGSLTGVATGPGTTFTVRATNGNGVSSQRSFRLSARPVFAGPATFQVASGDPADLAIQASDPEGQPLALSASGLPAGLSLADGRIQGVMPAPGVYAVTIRATDPDGGFTDRGYTLESVAAPNFAGAPGLIGSYTIGDANFLAGIVTSDPAGLEVTLALRPGSSLPAGISLSPEGTLSGTPSGAGTTFTVRATNSAGLFRDRTFRLNARPVLATQPGAASPAPNPGSPYSLTLAASDPEAQPLTWSVADGVLPGGLTLAPDTGVVSGTPDGATTSATLRVSDPDGGFADLPLTFVPDLRPAWQSPEAGALPPATNEGIFYTQTLSAIVQGGAGVSYGLVSGALPPGMAILPGAGGTATLRGTPSGGPGAFSFTIRATDGFGRFSDRAFTLRLNDRPTLPSGSQQTFPASPVGVPVSLPLAFVDLDPSDTLSCSTTAGTLPPGLSFSGCTIVGTPTGASSGVITVVASDGIANSLARGFRIPTFFADSGITPFEFSTLSFGTFTTAAQQTELRAVGGSFNVTLTARATGPKPFRLRAGSSLTGLGTSHALPVTNGMTVRFEAVANPSDGVNFANEDTYELVLEGPGGEPLYYTSFAAAGPERVIAPQPFSISDILNQASGASGLQSSVAAITGSNDRLTLAASGQGPFELRIGTSTTCTANPVVATSAAGEEVSGPVGDPGQSAGLTFRACLTQLSAPAAFSSFRTFALSLRDPLQGGAVLQEASFRIGTIDRDAQPNALPTLVIARSTATPPPLNFNEQFRISGGTNANGVPVQVAGTNVPLAVAVSGPRPASITIWTGSPTSCGSTGAAEATGAATAVQSSAFATPFRFCVTANAAPGFSTTDTYLVRLVDPASGETVFSQSVSATTIAPDPTPTASGSLGAFAPRLPGTVTSTNSTSVTLTAFNVPLRVRLSSPANGGVIVVRAGTVSACGNGVNVNQIQSVPGATASAATTFGPTPGSTGTYYLCAQTVSYPTEYGVNAIHGIVLEDASTGVPVASFQMPISTEARSVSLVGFDGATRTGLTFAGQSAAAEDTLISGINTPVTWRLSAVRGPGAVAFRVEPSSCPAAGSTSNTADVTYPTAPILTSTNFRVCAYATPDANTWGQTIEGDITAIDPLNGQALQTRTFSFQVNPRIISPSVTGNVGGTLSSTAAAGSPVLYFNSSSALFRQSRMYSSSGNSLNVPLSMTIQGPRQIDVARAGGVTSCESTVQLSYGGGGAESAPYLFAPNTTGGNTATSGFCFRNVVLPPAGTTDTYTVVVRDASPLASGGGTVVETWQFQVTKP